MFYVYNKLKNRLRLDFSLQTTEERLQFVNNYLPTLKFVPNEHETETLSDYILWGKNSKTGLNAQQEGTIVLKEWAPAAQIDSIDGLMELPGFQETKLHKLGDTHYKTRRTVFDRQAALQQADDNLKPVLENLFQQIDEVELLINYYDLKTGKRKMPPRASLLQKFNEEEQQRFQEKASSLTQRKYLQLRHYLVELRTEQYTYKDIFSPSILPRPAQIQKEEEPIRIDTDLNILPFGLHNGSKLSNKIFQWPPDPSKFTQEDLESINKQIWNTPNKKDTISFENPTHLLMMYKNYGNLEEDLDNDPDQFYTSGAAVLRTLQFYEQIANLSDLQRELLHMKIAQKSNNQIRDYVNQKYGKSYNDNYISTIYRQKILTSIADAARFHKEVMENVFYPENFKKCIDCGRLLLRSTDFFMKQKKSNDGYAPRCKMCQKKKREERKIRWEKEIIQTKN